MFYVHKATGKIHKVVYAGGTEMKVRVPDGPGRRISKKQFLEEYSTDPRLVR